MTKKGLYKLITKPHIFARDYIKKIDKNKKKEYGLKALNLNIPFDRYYYELYKIFKDNGHTQKAEEALRKALEKKSDAKYYYELGQLLKRKKQWWQIVEAYEKAMELNSNPPASWYKEYALALMQMNRFEDASKAWEKALKNSKNSDDWFKYGIALEKAKKIEDSKKAYQKAIELDKNKKAKKFGIGIFFEKKGEWIEACEKYKEVVENTPWDSELWYKYGLSLDRNYRWEEAEKALQKAISLEPNIDRYHYRLGFVYERQNKYFEAIEAYKKAIELNKKPSSYWFYRLVYVENKAGRFGNSVKTFLVMNNYDLSLLENDEEKLEIYDLKELLENKLKNLKSINNKYEELLELIYTNIINEKDLDKKIIFKKVKKEFSDLIENRDFLKSFTGNISDIISYLEKEIEKTEKEIEKTEKEIEKTEKEIEKTEAKINLIKEALENDTTRVDLWYELAKLNKNIKNYKDAIYAYERLLERKNDFEPKLYVELGFCYAMLGDYENGSKSFIEQEILHNQNLINSKKYKTSEAFKRKVDYTEYYERLKVQNNIVLFESFSGENFSDNSYAIFKAMIEDERFKEWKFIWVLNDKSKMPKEYLGKQNVIVIKRHSDLYLRYLATAKVLISNAVLPIYFIKKDEQIYINTWHGTPWKHLGLDNPYQNGNTARNFIQADFLVSPNSHTSNILLNRYGIKGYFQGKLLEIGYPRIDSMINMSEEGKESIKRKLGIYDDKPIVLYAPTYKGLWSDPDIEADEIIDYLENMKSYDYHLLFRGHYFVESKLENIDIDGVVVADHSIDSCELLSVVDTLITDYSSIMFDYLPREKPILIFAPDYEKYKEDRGLYLDIEFVPGYFIDDIKHLKSTIDKSIASPDDFIVKQNEYIETYSPHEDGQASLRLLNALIEELEQKDTLSRKRDKVKKVIAYPGHIESVDDIDLLKNFVDGKREIDPDIEFCVIFNKAELVTNKDILEKVEEIDGVSGLMEYSGAPIHLLEENWLVGKVNDGYIDLNYNNRDIYKKYYKREFRRLFGKQIFEDMAVLHDDNKILAKTLQISVKNTVSKEDV